MIKIKQLNSVGINKYFNIFCSNTLKGTHSEQTYFVSQMDKFQRQYSRLGLLDVFCDKAAVFAEKLATKGQNDFAGIIYSTLVKIAALNPKQKEFYAQKALQIAHIQKDPIHVLARTVDLKKIYRVHGRKRQFLDACIAEERALINVIKNFESSNKNFRTVKRAVSPVGTYEKQLAFARVEIAKGIFRSQPELAQDKLLKAQALFDQLNMKKELDFVKLLLSQINNG